MQKFIKKYSIYFEPKSIRMIKKCFILSILTCLCSLLISFIHYKYYISIHLFEASLILFRTGIMIGIFPIVFTVIIEKWKKES